MRRLALIATGNLIVVGTLVFLIQHDAIKLYPAGFLVIVVAFLLDTWLLAKASGSMPAKDSDRAEGFGRRGTRRLL
jgi:hypothetical protein